MLNERLRKSFCISDIVYDSAGNLKNLYLNLNFAIGWYKKNAILPNVVVNLTFAFLLQNNDEIIIIDISRRLDFGIQLSCL